MFSARLGKLKSRATGNLPGGRKFEGRNLREEQEEERWEGRVEERSEDSQNSLVHVAPHADDRDRETDERADERVEVIEPDGSRSPRLPRGEESG